MNTDHFGHGQSPSSSHVTGQGAGTGPFSPADVEAFGADDRGAATAIVGLMAGIFTIGLIGYALVCLWVAS
jgi:hypothetical protein